MMVVVRVPAMGRRLVAGVMDDTGGSVDRYLAVSVLALMLNFVTARMARMRAHDRNQPRDDGADQGQKDDGLYHRRFNPSSD
jgi:hypothetical protein